MIVEMRTYRVKLGTRPQMLELIRTKLFAELKRLGGKCAGPWASTDDEVTIFWMRGFADTDARQIISNKFYGGAFWEETSVLILPNLEKHEVVAVEMDEHAVQWA